jgi:hypothetical protein
MQKAKKTFRDLYSDLSDDEAKEAEFNITRYFEVVLKIGERLAVERNETKDDHPLS